MRNKAAIWILMAFSAALSAASIVFLLRSFWFIETAYLTRNGPTRGYGIAVTLWRGSACFSLTSHVPTAEDRLKPPYYRAGALSHQLRNEYPFISQWEKGYLYVGFAAKYQKEIVGRYFRE